MTIPKRPIRKKITGLPAFTTVKGGAYFFLPGIRALRFLADGVHCDARVHRLCFRGRLARERHATDRLLIRGANASVVVFVVSSTLSVGLGLTVPQIVAPLRNGRLVALSLLANFVLAPVAAIALARVLGLDEPLAVGLLLVAVAGGAPFLLKLADLARADMPFAVGLMVGLMVITVGYMPIVLPLLLPGVSVNPANIAKSLIVLMLIPLAVGLALRAWQPRDCRSPQGVRRAGVEHQHDFCRGPDHGGTPWEHGEHPRFVRHRRGADLCRDLFRHRLGARRSRRATRGVLSLGTAQRNTAAALVVAGQNFTDAKVVVMITVVMIVSFAVLMPLARLLAGRQQPAVGVRAAAAP